MPASTRSGRSRGSPSIACCRPARSCARSTRGCLTRSACCPRRKCRPTFHPRFDARRKTYRYRIWNGEVISPFERRYAWHLVARARRRRDAGRGATARRTPRLRGVSGGRQRGGDHRAGDLRPALRHGGRGRETLPADRRTRACAFGQPDVRDAGFALRCTHRLRGDRDGFLRHMVRIIVGTLVEIGRGRQPVEWIGAPADVARSRGRRGRRRLPKGSFLVTVDYGDSLAAEP